MQYLGSILDQSKKATSRSGTSGIVIELCTRLLVEIYRSLYNTNEKTCKAKVSLSDAEVPGWLLPNDPAVWPEFSEDSRDKCKDVGIAFESSIPISDSPIAKPIPTPLATTPPPLPAYEESPGIVIPFAPPLPPVAPVPPKEIPVPVPEVPPS